ASSPPSPSSSPASSHWCSLQNSRQETMTRKRALPTFRSRPKSRPSRRNSQSWHRQHSPIGRLWTRLVLVQNNVSLQGLGR
ncbi:hypothetical protein PMAYCL1PPCAC_09043, partial [Pristionchus mayeri]